MYQKKTKDQTSFTEMHLSSAKVSLIACFFFNKPHDDMKTIPFCFAGKNQSAHLTSG